jgi:glycosyltransferase involved in cell wall biosynthesis
MKILHINNNIGEGGVGIALYHLHQGLRTKSVESKVMIRDLDKKPWLTGGMQRYSIDDDEVILAPEHKLIKQLDNLKQGLIYLAPDNKLTKGLIKIIERLDYLPLGFYPNRIKSFFHLQWIPDAVAPKITQFNPDVINLHWIYDGLIQIETLPKFNKPIVWTCHDMWPITGGCVLNTFIVNNDIQECNRYINSCGACPQLGSRKDWDISRWVWQRKAKAWKNLSLTLVTPSSWLAERVRSSSLFRNRRVEVIPNGLDAENFIPIEKQLARKRLDLPSNKQIVLFGAGKINDPNKGFHKLQPALQKLSESGWQDKIELVVFGAADSNQLINFGFKFRYLGRLKDDRYLALAYSAADVMVVPSLQESFGQTASESLACGTPVVAFNATGLKDIVDHEQNGYLAKPYEIGDLARGIAWVLGDSDRYQRLARCARKKVEQEFTREIQARRYLALYEDIVETRH